MHRAAVSVMPCRRFATVVATHVWQQFCVDGCVTYVAWHRCTIVVESWIRGSVHRFIECLHRFIERFCPSCCEISMYDNQIALKHDPVALSSVVVALSSGVLEGVSVVFKAFSEHEPALA